MEDGDAKCVPVFFPFLRAARCSGVITSISSHHAPSSFLANAARAARPFHHIMTPVTACDARISAARNHTILLAPPKMSPVCKGRCRFINLVPASAVRVFVARSTVPR